jgi:hypothetical protein
LGLPLARFELRKPEATQIYVSLADTTGNAVPSGSPTAIHLISFAALAVIFTVTTLARVAL